MFQAREDFPRILVPLSLVVRLVVDFTYVGGEIGEERAVPAAEGMRAEETEEGGPRLGPKRLADLHSCADAAGWVGGHGELGDGYVDG